MFLTSKAVKLATKTSQTGSLIGFDSWCSPTYCVATALLLVALIAYQDMRRDRRTAAADVLRHRDVGVPYLIAAGQSLQL